MPESGGRKDHGKPAAATHGHGWRSPTYWWAWLAIICAALLVPWIVYLRFNLTKTYVVENWLWTWVGLDVIMVICFVLTAVAAWRRSSLFVVIAAMTGMMLLLDGWFDVMTANLLDKPSSISTLAIETPLGIALIIASVGHLRHLRRGWATAAAEGAQASAGGHAPEPVDA